jgi:ABC-type phosphate transport system ATPase subunit
MSSSQKFILKDLTLSLHSNSPILKNISLEIPTGQITSLIGPSGSGKSTLLRCLNRLWEPPAESIFLDKIDITTLDVLALRRRVGMLFQSAALFEGTVASNVAYGPGLRRQPLSLVQIEELLRMAGLDPSLIQKPADELSGGQAQRVALARALANEPEVLLLDEPTSALDPAATRHVEETILRLRDTLGLTVVWVSHTIDQVERTADQMALLVDGTIAEIGTPDHLLSGAHHHLTEDFAQGKL